MRSPTLRSVELTFLAFSATEQAAWIGILVFVYQAGGVVEAGLVAGLQLLPAVVLAPSVALAGDRWRRDRVVVGSYFAQAMCMALVFAAMIGEMHRIVVYVASALACVALACTRPAVASLLPTVARDPEDLAAANAATGIFDNCGSLLGPLLAAAALGIGGPPLVFAILACLMGAAALALYAAVRGFQASASSAPPEPGSLAKHVLAGIEFLRREPDTLALVLCVAAPAVALGALDVLVVAAASEQLGAAEHMSAYLFAAFGFGGLLGATGAVALVGSRRLIQPYGAGVLLLGVPLMGMALVSSLPVALGFLFLCGVGESFAGVAGMTLIQRSTPDRVRGRVFGLFEGLYIGGLSLGALSVSGVYASLGLAGTFVAAGFFVPALLVVSQRRLRRVDAAAHPSPELVLGSLGSDPILAPLSPDVLARLGRRTSLLALQQGAFVVREGEPGDRYYRVVGGELEVRVGNQVVRTLRKGDSLGEIALLQSVPRTATVVARTHAELLAMDRADFLEAVASGPDDPTESDR